MPEQIPAQPTMAEAMNQGGIASLPTEGKKFEPPVEASEDPCGRVVLRYGHGALGAKREG